MDFHLRIKKEGTAIQPHQMIHMEMTEQKIQTSALSIHLPLKAPVKISDPGSCIQDHRFVFCMDCHAGGISPIFLIFRTTFRPGPANSPDSHLKSHIHSPFCLPYRLSIHILSL